MGLIRKTLAVGTVGVVRGSSKKQRNAKAQLKELREQTELLRQEDAERRRVSAQNYQAGVQASQREAVQREQLVTALWQMRKSGVLTQEQYEAAYAALAPPAATG